VAETHAPDEVYDEGCRNFSEKEVVDLTFAIFTINAWNRLAIGFRMQPLVPQPAKAA
jgi:alkylhydroperoxidase family enzyme